MCQILFFKIKIRDHWPTGQILTAPTNCVFFPVDKVCARSLPTKLASIPKCLLW